MEPERLKVIDPVELEKGKHLRSRAATHRRRHARHELDQRNLNPIALETRRGDGIRAVQLQVSPNDLKHIQPLLRPDGNQCSWCGPIGAWTVARENLV